MAALRFPQREDVPEVAGYAYQRSLGDLVMAMVAPGIESHLDGNAPDPVGEQSFEGMYMYDLALELRALSLALVTPDDSDLSRAFTADDGARLLATISRRTAAAAELSARLREARHGSVEDES